VFDSIGWGEIVVLLLAALFIFGPERLPDLARDAARGTARVREAVVGVRKQMTDALGEDVPELPDLDPRRYHPKALVRWYLLDGDAEEPPVDQALGTIGSRARWQPVQRDGDPG
jgi:sec-independent protein translocase protein TatB